MNKKNTFSARSTMIAFFSILLVSCSVSNGYLKKNIHPLDLSQTKISLPDYNYYFTGRSNQPYAVIGIDKKYAFNTRGWFKIENMNDALKKISSLDDRQELGVSDFLLYADIVGGSGMKVGIWFSYYTYAVVNIDQENKSVIVLNPYSPGKANDS